MKWQFLKILVMVVSWLAVLCSEGYPTKQDIINYQTAPDLELQSNIAEAVKDTDATLTTKSSATDRAMAGISQAITTTQSATTTHTTTKARRTTKNGSS